MDLDFDVCWRASESRDARFDGRFYIGVHSTGVYCRPICPAPSPKRENVRFYRTAAASEAAGLRPCRRCRPELAPGTPEWLGGSAVVARGLRLIDEGFLDRYSVPALARELFAGERQLRRLFEEHLGAPPSALARTRRVRLARTLLDDTALSITDVARAAGFASLRRFNDAVRETYGRSPSELRRNGRVVAGEALELRLSYRPPFAWDELLRFLGMRAVPGLEQVDGTIYRRAVGAGESAAIVELEHTPPVVFLRLRGAGIEALGSTVERARQFADLDADPEQIGAVLARDHALRDLVACRPGLRVPGAWDGFELAVRAVLGQQVSVRGAATLAGRLVARFGERLLEPAAAVTHVFPSPDALVEADVQAVGIPEARAETIRRLARAVAAGSLVLGPSAPFDETRTRLLAVPGIGPWTVEYVAMRALRDPDAFPDGDLGLRRAGATWERAERWRPWRAYAALHLWTAETERLEAAA
jgi:AraC family transcriptional regulator, regulatory protein of adaptative response / DNA-3-methyladenine glycosylase II